MTTEEKVNEALDDAVENDYREFIFQSSDEEVADDLIDNFKPLENETPESLTPFIRKWKEDHRNVSQSV